MDFKLIEKIDSLVESKQKCRLMDKSGRYLHGVISDSYIRYSSGKLRGKLTLESQDKGQLEIDANDIYDIQPSDNKS